ncbi:N-alpha-acetyltransferase 30 [Irineochytrium annulatum]|nr:N-alpha-acetyltransferase 30 [Irineochytrium annulatum]
MATDAINVISYVPYESELQLPSIMRLIENDLSEPYSIYTYRYFLHAWPQLSFLVISQ